MLHCDYHLLLLALALPSHFCIFGVQEALATLVSSSIFHISTGNSKGQASKHHGWISCFTIVILGGLHYVSLFSSFVGIPRLDFAFSCLQAFTSMAMILSFLRWMHLAVL
ncbi:hypothetical protein EV356DRAFT_53728 [Viridothelium virens]|uniref:Uncharacterized protein n=1 Tax=Viridothelium virens TaxID=1048519 RepID=A0A6A6HH21_VIRVR|nr:hypothetical protein EV356DRAFT_53728 [Viridothelium virens]